MRTSEEAALGRVLAISREAYSAVKNGETELNQVALLDALSAALSHVNNEKKAPCKVHESFEIRDKTCRKAILRARETTVFTDRSDTAV